MVLDAVDMAAWSRGARIDGLRCHSDAGSPVHRRPLQRTPRRARRHPSIGSVGDCYDNALAETVNGLYKTELIRGPPSGRPWQTVDDVELATLGWVHWHNTERLHGHLGDVPPAEFEAALLRCPTARPDRGWKPITRASTKPRAIQFCGCAGCWGRR